MKPEIRRATAEDIPLLITMMEAFYAESDYPLDRAWAAKAFVTLFADPALGAVWIVSAGNEPAGYVILTLRFSMEYGGREGAIDDLFVRAAYRRRGLARLVLRALFEESRRRGVLAIHVEVAEDNEAAKALYASFGLAPRTDNRLLLNVALEPELPDP